MSLVQPSYFDLTFSGNRKEINIGPKEAVVIFHPWKHKETKFM